MRRRYRQRGGDAERCEFGDRAVLFEPVDLVDDEDQRLGGAAQAIEDAAVGR